MIGYSKKFLVALACEDESSRSDPHDIRNEVGIRLLGTMLDEALAEGRQDKIDLIGKWTAPEGGLSDLRAIFPTAHASMLDRLEALTRYVRGTINLTPIDPDTGEGLRKISKDWMMRLRPAAGKVPKLGEPIEVHGRLDIRITGPFSGEPDYETLGAQGHVHSRTSQDGWIRNFTWEEAETLCYAVQLAKIGNPNAGYPRGSQIWADKTVFHGTDRTSAASILQSGISIARSNSGYFGKAFYAADTEETARDNYADFSSDEGNGVVLVARIDPINRILDLRNHRDSEVWAQAMATAGVEGYTTAALAAGIDGVYDRSVGGLAIYNPAILQEIAIKDPEVDPEYEPGF